MNMKINWKIDLFQSFPFSTQIRNFVIRNQRQSNKNIIILQWKIRLKEKCENWECNSPSTHFCIIIFVYSLHKYSYLFHFHFLFFVIIWFYLFHKHFSERIKNDCNMDSSAFSFFGHSFPFIYHLSLGFFSFFTSVHNFMDVLYPFIFIVCTRERTHQIKHRASNNVHRSHVFVSLSYFFVMFHLRFCSLWFFWNRHFDYIPSAMECFHI